MKTRFVRRALPALLCCTAAWTFPARADTPQQQWEFASGLYAQKLWSLAAENLRAFVQANPKDAHAKLAAYQLGAALYRADNAKGVDYASAAKAYESALAAYPDAKLSATARYELGDAYYQLKQYARSITTYRAFLQSQPPAPQAAEALYGIGQSLEALNRQSEARAAYRTVSTTYATTRPAPYALLALGVLADDAGDNAGALAAFQGVLTRYGKSEIAPEARLRAANSMLALNKFALARDAFKAALSDAASQEFKSDALLGLADAQFGLKAWPDAGAAYEQALAALPSDDARRAATTLRQGDAYFNAKNYERALAVYTPLIGSSDKTIAPDALYFQAASLRALNRLDEAANAYRGFLAKFPTHARASSAALRLGDTLADAKEPVKAAEAYRVVLTRYATSPAAKDAREALVGLVGQVANGASGTTGSGAATSGQNSPDATQSAQLEGVLRALPPGPTASNAQLRLAQAAFARGDNAGALRLAQAALTAKPDAQTLQSALYLVASSQARAQQPGVAAQSFRRLLSVDPRGVLAPQARLGLTWALLDAKQPQAAAVAAQSAVALLTPQTPKTLSVQTRLALGEALLDAKNYAGAAKAFAGVENDADKEFAVQGVYGAALALEGAKQWASASARWGKYASLQSDVPSRARAYLRQGLALNKAKNAAGALAAFDRATAVDANGESGLRALYESAWVAHDFAPAQEAARWERLAGAVSPYTNEARFQLGETRFAANSWQDAATAYRAVTNDAKSEFAPLAFYKLGSALFNLQQWREAASAFDSASKLKSEVTLESAFWAGESLKRADDLNEAKSRYQAFLASAGKASAPKSAKAYLPQARLGFGQALLASSDAAGAVRVLQEAQASGVTGAIAAEIAFRLGEAFNKSGNFKGAATQFLKVVTLYPKSAFASQASFEAAQATEKSGDRAAARALYEAVAARQPASEYAAQAQQKLKELP